MKKAGKITVFFIRKSDFYLFFYNFEEIKNFTEICDKIGNSKNFEINAENKGFLLEKAGFILFF